MRVRRKLEDLSRPELLEKAKTDFQAMVRAEAGAYEGDVVICDPRPREVFSEFGQCVCATCGKPYPWRGTNLLNTGHCVPGRRQCIVFDPRNVAPQCVSCNKYHGGYPDRMANLVAYVYGTKVLDELRRKNRMESKTWQKSELLEMIQTYRARTKAAVDAMSVGLKNP